MLSNTKLTIRGEHRVMVIGVDYEQMFMLSETTKIQTSKAIKSE